MIYFKACEKDSYNADEEDVIIEMAAVIREMEDDIFELDDLAISEKNEVF
jgi:hypothetical protein